MWVRLPAAAPVDADFLVVLLVLFVLLVPLLGDVPVIGHLFKNTIKQDDKTELLIFVTPKIVKDSLTIR